MKGTGTLKQKRQSGDTAAGGARENIQQDAGIGEYQRRSTAQQESSAKIDFSSMRHSIEQNLQLWNDQYDWSEDGDEWDGQARHCAQPYSAWKQSIIETFILPYISRESKVLEIAAGRGRWSREIVDLCAAITLLDLSPSCIEYCRMLFASKDNVSYIVNDGRTLPGVSDGEVDFIWSFDSFIHMTDDVIDSYMREIQRVLRIGGVAVIHHPGRRNFAVQLKFLKGMGKGSRILYKYISLGKLRQDDGWRSDISREMVAQLTEKNGLTVEGQFQRWGRDGEFSLDKYNDYITVLGKPQLD